MVIFDTGGGSSQFTFGRGAAVTEQFSLNVGAVRFAEAYRLAGVVSPAELQRAIDAIAGDLSRLDAAAVPDALRRNGRRGDQSHRRHARPAHL